jgi:hypothetical protein
MIDRSIDPSITHTSAHPTDTYTQLEQHVEARLLALSPPQVQAQMARLRAAPPNPDEVASMERELRAWEEEARARDRGLVSGAVKGSGAKRCVLCVLYIYMCGGWGGWLYGCMYGVSTRQVRF